MYTLTILFNIEEEVPVRKTLKKTLILEKKKQNYVYIQIWFCLIENPKKSDLKEKLLEWIHKVARNTINMPMSIIFLYLINEQFKNEILKIPHTNKN